MRRNEEINNPSSCLNKAKAAEMLFVLLGRDGAAPAAIRYWEYERVRRGLNKWGDAKLIEAEKCAMIMEMEQPK